MFPLLFLLVFQNATPKFERLSVLDGLSQSQVLAIAQDQFGFLWMGTQDGLNRYDGYQFQVFRNDSDEMALSDNHIQSLLVDRQNNLWIGTKEGGLMVWDLNTNQLQTFRHQEEDETSIGGDNVWTLLEDPSGQIWVGTIGGGLSVWEPETKRFHRYLHVPEDEHSLSDNRIRSLYQDERGMLWVGTDGGLNRKDPESDQFTRYKHDPDNSRSLPKGFIFALAPGDPGELWVGSVGGGLSLLDTKTDEFTHFRTDPNQPGSLSDNRIWSLFKDNDGRLWVGTLDRGLNLWHPETQSFEVFRNSKNAKSLSSNKVWSIFEDRSGILWLGTGDHGINKLNYHAKPFLHLPKPTDDATSAENLVTMAFTHLGDETWVGTWGQGLFKLNADAGTLEKIPMPPTETDSPRLFVSLFAQNQRYLWMGTWAGGLRRLDLKTLQETVFKWDFGKESPGLHVIQVQPWRNQFLLMTYGDGVVLFDPESQQFSRLENKDGPIEALTEGNFFCVNNQTEHELWLGTVGKGLYRLDLKTMALRIYQKNEREPNHLPSDRITVLLKDSQQRFWVGTDGGGLARYLPEGDHFQAITTKTGLPSNVINGILEGPTGNLWVATNKGLDFFEPETGNHRIFGPGDGLQLEYNAGVFTKSASGHLLFGGPKGIDYFQPVEIKQNPYIPQIVFSQFKVFNQPRNVGQSLNKTGIIELDYTDNFFAFEFASMDFSYPQKNRFRVQLEGVDKDWVFNGNRNYKEYTNLLGGTYTFKVQGSNGDGVWNEFGRQIKVRIIPPFWQTPMFLALGTLILLSVVIGIVHFFERKKILRLENSQKVQAELNNRLAEAREVERVQIAQEIHDGPIQDLHAIQFQMSLAQEKNDYANIGKYLLSVISSLRRLCGHLRPPALVPFGLAAAIRSLVDAMRDKYPNTNITLNLDNDGQKIPQDVRLALFRICQEALNNALQHAEAETVKILFKVDRVGLHLIVSDDGKGFVLGENLLAFSSEGHYGLLGISERIQAIGGKVTIDTQPGSGTKVKILIRREKAAKMEVAAFA